MNIAFVGLGHFGKAIASLVEYNDLEYDYAEAVEGRLLSQKADLLFLTVPAQFIRQALLENKEFIDDKTIIVNCTKGIEKKTRLMAHQIVRESAGLNRYYSLIGPSFAQGIIDKHPTVVSLGYKNPNHLKQIKQVVETPYFKVKECRGFRALELASALKNLYAIACGYANGLGFGPNTQAQIITLALAEFRTLAKAMRFADYDVMAPGVVGDLVLTCTSKQSRNFQYGLQLAQTKKRGEPEHTVEGYYTSQSIDAIAKAEGVKLPLAALTSAIISGKVTDAESFRRLLARS